MTLTLEREPATGGAIFGRLAIDGVFQCWTLEGTATVFPAGRYRVVITPSLRFKMLLPLLENVPGRMGVRLHAGNSAADTSGCVLLGQRRGTLDGQPAVLESRAALAAFQPRLAAALRIGPVLIDVTSATGA
mgnify:CR=1 FL=1